MVPVLVNLGAARRQPKVDERQHDGAAGRSPRRPAPRMPDRRPGRGPGRSCADRRRSPRSGSARRPARVAAPASQAARGQDAAGERRSNAHEIAPITAQASPRADQHETAGQGRDGQRRAARIAAGQDPHRLGTFECGQDQRPAEAGRHRGRPRRVEDRHADHDRVLHRRDLLDPQPGRRLGRRPGRHAIGDVGGRPLRFADDHDEPALERGIVHGDRVEAVADLERDALATIVEVGPAARARGPGGASGGTRADDGPRPRSRSPSRSGPRSRT